MSENTHPSYPKPTIREALCEVRFPGDAVAFPAQFARFWSQAQTFFPTLEAHVDQFIAITGLTAPASATLAAPPPRPRFVLRHGTRSVIVQAVDGAVTFNVPAPYLGWETMSQDIREVWQMATEAFRPATVAGLSLRYIDAIPQPPETVGAVGWLEPGDYVPPAILRAPAPFFSRVQTEQTAGDVTAVTISYERVGPLPPTTMIVDFERTLTRTLDADVGAVLDRVDALHEDIWQLFRAIKGPRWNDALGEK